MQAFNSFPYLTIPQERIEVHSWELPGGRPLGPSLEDWDPGRDVLLRSTFTLDPLEVRGHCGLGQDSRLSLAATWRSSGTTLRGRGVVVPLPSNRSGQQEYRMALTVPGLEISERLEIRTSVVLVSQGNCSNALAPVYPGSVLWLHQISIDLEGGLPMFPVCAVPFSQVRGWSPDALWVLDWDPSSIDLHSQFSAEVRLCMNTEHPAYRAFGGTHHQRGQQEEAFHSVLVHDLAENLVEAGLDRADEVDAEEFPPGSVGRILSTLISSTFHGMGASQVALERRRIPGWFSTRLQASSKLFGTLGSA